MKILMLCVVSRENLEIGKKAVEGIVLLTAQRSSYSVGPKARLAQKVKAKGTRKL